MLNEISGIPMNTKIISGPAEYRTVQSEESAKQTQSAFSPAAIAEFSDEWTEKNWQDLTQKTIEQLKKQYPSLNIVAARPGSSVSDMAVSLGSGTHLVISEAFLKRMCSSAEEFSKCSTALSDIAGQLMESSGHTNASGAYVRENSASFWSAQAAARLPIPGQESGLNIPAGQKAVKHPKFSTSSDAYRVSKYYNEVASAKSRIQIQSVMSEVHRHLVNLRTAALSDDKKESAKAKKALRSLQKLLTRGNRKIKRLGQEEVTRARQKRAEREVKEKKAEFARLELKKMRSERNRKDIRMVQEGMQDEAGIRHSYGYQSTRNAYQRIMQPPSEFIPFIMPAEIMPIADVTFSAADVVITDAVTF